MERREENMKAITRVFPDGEKVCAIVLDYSVEVEASSLDSDTYTVEVVYEGDLHKRTVKNVYVSQSETDLVRKPSYFPHFAKKGRYVVLELDTSEPLAKTFRYESNGLAKRLQLEHKVRQIKKILTTQGWVQDRDFIVREERHWVIDEFQQFVFEKDGVKIPYRLFIPSELEPGKKYPLVVFLHGGGERGTDNYVQLATYRGAVVWAEPRVQVRFPCFVLAPQCPPESGWTKRIFDGNFFEPTRELLAVVGIIESLLKDYSIDEERIYITGLSMGGAGTFALVAEYPDFFAAAVPICGVGDPAKVESMKKVPMWVFHAEDDGVVPVSFSREIVKRLVRSGGYVRYTEYEKGYMEKLGFDPHASWIPAYEREDLIEWLFQQRKGKVK